MPGEQRARNEDAEQHKRGVHYLTPACTMRAAAYSKRVSVSGAYEHLYR
jgi:hypothetical protein